MEIPKVFLKLFQLSTGCLMNQSRLVYFVESVMQTINIFQAKTHLLKLIEQIASGKESEFIIFV